MSQPETTFYRGVHKWLPVHLYRSKMHNPFAGGMWDVWYSGKRDLWVEYKFVKLPARSTTMIDVGLSALQIQWGAQRLREGRNLLVIVGCKEGGVIFHNLEWEQPILCGDFMLRLLSREAIAKYIDNFTSRYD